MSDEPFRRQIVAAKAVEDGFLAVCDCGVETHVVTVAKDADGKYIPTPLEFAFTCDGCGSSHWFTITPQNEGGNDG